LSEGNEHLSRLQTARERAVTARRELAKQLAKGNKNEPSARNRTAFVNVQNAIEAIDRAMEDETTLGAKKRAELSDEALARTRWPFR
jgi:phage anti-repressor protein